MRIQKVIASYKQNITDSINNKKPFEMIYCKSKTCNCVQGIRWDCLTFDCGTGALAVKNGYQFNLSMDLSSELEDLFLPLIQPERLNQTWDNDRVVINKRL